MTDFYKTGAAAGILLSGMLEALAQGEPPVPVVGGYTTPDGTLGVVPLGSEDHAIAWQTTDVANPVVVLNNHVDNEVAVLVPAPANRDQLALIYLVQYARGGGRLFTSTPSRTVRVPDVDMIREFNRGFDESIDRCKKTVDLSGWGELGAYEEVR